MRVRARGRGRGRGRVIDAARYTKAATMPMSTADHGCTVAQPAVMLGGKARRGKVGSKVRGRG